MLDLLNEYQQYEQAPATIERSTSNAPKDATPKKEEEEDTF